MSARTGRDRAAVAHVYRRLSMGPQPDLVAETRTADEAIARALDLARPGDVVLIAGKGHESRQIFKDRIVPFDDRETARALLSLLPAEGKGGGFRRP